MELSESAYDAAIKAACRHFKLEPHGVFCVDMKENRQDRLCVTEINAGRFFTTSNFFAEAGCNMPAIAVRLGLGLPIPETQQYDAVPAGLYWVRQMDMGHRLFTKKPEFSSK